MSFYIMLVSGLCSVPRIFYVNLRYYSSLTPFYVKRLKNTHLRYVASLSPGARSMALRVMEEEGK